MISKASVKYLRISPRKMRYVIDLIRKKSVNEARRILSGTPRRAGEIVSKLMNQAVDAAVKNSHAHVNDLFVSTIMADGGPSMRRFRAASMGRASIIHKRTTHLYLELDQVKSKVLLPETKLKTSKEPLSKKKAAVSETSVKAIEKKATKKKLAGVK